MANQSPSIDPVVVVGAGMAGLSCAAALAAAGRSVLLLEASDGAGGRVRTDRHPDGFLLDRGFQVILEAYPALRRQVSIEALRPGRFDAGARVWTGRRLVPLADPLRHPAALPRDLSSSLFPFADKLRLARFALRVRSAPWESVREAAANRSALDELRAAGFGDRFVDRFGRPFWGGISLDPALGGDAGPLRFTLKMFLLGAAVLPAEGVSAVPAHLVRRLPTGSLHLNRRVERIVTEGGRATGVVVAGETIAAAVVVVATDPPTARRLTGIEAIPARGVGCTTVFLRGRRDPGVGKTLVLDGTGARAVNHLAPLSAVQPTYAPAGEHLLAAVMLGVGPLADPDDERLGGRARADAAAMLGHDPADWLPLAVTRVPFSQYAQPPGIYATLPTARTGTQGLFLASEATVDSSLNGAILGGEAAAKAVLEDMRR